ncbi:unnamed protein product [Pedinophyceae sp. YPF-701]|nr:unnamed protein product [Pedinophyceae sp. YPF-701]
MTTLAQLKRKTKAELVVELEQRGLDTAGNKDDLVTRLKEAMDSAPADHDDIAADLDAEIEGDTAPAPAPAAQAPAPAAATPEPAADATPAAAADAAANADVGKLQERAKRFGVNGGAMTEEQKKKARAMRFEGGKSLDTMIKEGKGRGKGKGKGGQEAKAAGKDAAGNGAAAADPLAGLSDEQLEKMKARAGRFGASTSGVLKQAEKRELEAAMQAKMDERAKRFKA